MHISNSAFSSVENVFDQQSEHGVYQNLHLPTPWSNNVGCAACSCHSTLNATQSLTS
jgi:hypothetical protein